MQIPVSMPTQKYQIALFPQVFLGQGTQNWNQIFAQLVGLQPFADGGNFIIPLPTDTPTNTPRILLKSSDEKISCTISSEKIDIFWNNPEDRADFVCSLEDRLGLMNEIIGIFSPVVSFKRVGSIHNFYFQVNEEHDPVRNEVFQESIRQNMRDYNIRFTYPENILDTNCNYVFDLTQGVHKETSERLLIIQADINTHQDVAINWSIEQVRSFINASEEFLVKEGIVRRLFPGL